jgi:hypothetical protein
MRVRIGLPGNHVGTVPCGDAGSLAHIVVLRIRFAHAVLPGADNHLPIRHGESGGTMKAAIKNEAKSWCGLASSVVTITSTLFDIASVPAVGVGILANYRIDVWKKIWGE